MTNNTDGTINVFYLLYYLKEMLFYNSFGQFGSEEMVGDGKLQENVVCIKLDNIKSNGVSDWFKK